MREVVPVKLLSSGGSETLVLDVRFVQGATVGPSHPRACPTDSLGVYVFFDRYYSVLREPSKLFCDEFDWAA